MAAKSANLSGICWYSQRLQNMRKTFNIIRIFLLLFLMAGIAGTVGCAKDTEQGGVAEESNLVHGTSEEYTYVPTFHEIKVPLGEKSRELAAFVKDGKLYSVIADQQSVRELRVNVIITDIATGEQSEVEAEPVYKYYDTVNGFAGYDDYATNIIYFYDENFMQTGQMNIGSTVKELESRGMTFSLNDIVVDNDGNIGIAGKDAVLLFDSDYNLIKTIEKTNYIKSYDKLMTTKEGSWYAKCSCTSSSGAAYSITGIFSLDMAQGRVSAEIDILNGYGIWFSQKMNHIGDGGFYYCGDGCVYGYEENTAKVEEVFRMSDYGIYTNNASSMGEDGAIYIINSIEYNDMSVDYEVVAAAKHPASEVKARTEIILGSFYEPLSYQRIPIMEFNKYNTDYYCTIKCYGYTDDNEDVARQNFYNDLLKGTGADVFLFGYDDKGRIDISSLGGKGILADLYDFIDKDDELDRAAFLPGVLEQMEYTDGKLYVIYNDFYINCSAGKASIFAGYDEWTYETLLEIMKKYPDALLEVQRPRADIMQEFMMYSMGSFYDMDMGVCSFDSDEFKAFLEVVSMIPEKPDMELRYSLASLLDTDKVLLYCHPSVVDASNLQESRLYFGDNDITYIGFPSTGGNAGMNFRTGVAINAGSANVAGAWELVKCYIEQPDLSLGCVPVLQQVFDDYADERYSRYSGLSSDFWNDGYTTFKDVSVTDEDWQAFHAVVDGARGWTGYDAEIYEIIDEEAQGYFAGARSVDETAATIQDRVKLYIDERQ